MPSTYVVWVLLLIAVLQLLGKYAKSDDVKMDDMLQDLPMAILSGDKHKNNTKIVMCDVFT